MQSPGSSVAGFFLHNGERSRRVTVGRLMWGSGECTHVSGETLRELRISGRRMDMGGATSDCLGECACRIRVVEKEGCALLIMGVSDLTSIVRREG